MTFILTVMMIVGLVGVGFLYWSAKHPDKENSMEKSVESNIDKAGAAAKAKIDNWKNKPKV